MSSRRVLKAAEAIREVVSMAILTELRDPRVKNVTVVGVEVLPDMRQAKVHVSIMGDEKEQQLGLSRLAERGRLLAEEDRRADRHPLHAAAAVRARQGREELARSRIASCAKCCRRNAETKLPTTTNRRRA